MASIEKETYAMHREVTQLAQVSQSLKNGDDIRWKLLGSTLLSL